MIAAVFDCVIFVQALLSRKGPAFACLRMAEEEYVTLYLSPEVLDEIKRALGQDALRQRYPRITNEVIGEFLSYLEKIATITQDPPAIFALQRDPHDEAYLNLAIETSAGFVVSLKTSCI